MKAIKSDTTADLRHFDSGAARFWSPELRRAMMKVRPEYFRWPVERGERYGVAIPRRDAASLDKALSKELFGKSYATRKEAATAAGRLSLHDQDRWNETVLPLHGIGEDCFYLNEPFAKNKNILDFDAVRAFDESDYRLQEKARRKEDPKYSGKPYRGSLYLNWARLYVDGRFAYATLSMAAGYTYARVSDVAHELLARLIPHRYAPGKHYGKVEGGGWQWDLRVDANGQEPPLENYSDRSGVMSRSVMMPC